MVDKRAWKIMWEVVRTRLRYSIYDWPVAHWPDSVTRPHPPAKEAGKMCPEELREYSVLRELNSTA